MSELQLSGLLFILIGALPTYLLTKNRERKTLDAIQRMGSKQNQGARCLRCHVMQRRKNIFFCIRCHGNAHDARRRRERYAYPDRYLSLSRTVVLLHT